MFPIDMTNKKRGSKIMRVTTVVVNEIEVDALTEEAWSYYLKGKDITIETEEDLQELIDFVSKQTGVSQYYLLDDLELTFPQDMPQSVVVELVDD